MPMQATTLDIFYKQIIEIK